MAATSRFFGTYSLGFYKPLYFAKTYPTFIDEFSLGNAAIYVLFATSSALIGGKLSDKLEPYDLRSKSYLCMACCGLSAPLLLGSLLNQDDFWFSLGLLGAHYVISEIWISPSITML
jgi:nitrate/nitrite transporter NarK